MHCELIDRMGDDLRVVNAARVSFDKESNWDKIGYNPASVRNEDGTWETKMVVEPRGIEWSSKVEKKLNEKDVKLLSYLAREGHWTPFSHVQITMRETVPIFVARQRFKHMVGFTYNEVSRRYVSDEPSFFHPESWRKAAENKKQGSSDEIVDLHNFTQYGELDDGEWKYSGMRFLDEQYTFVMNRVTELYHSLLEAGVAPEQARMVLPQSMYTSYYVTGSLSAWARAYKLRSDSHSQKEIQDLAVQWNDIIASIPELKYSWEALTK